MSKRSDYFERAVFFAQQDPKLLANVLLGALEDAPAYITISGSTVVENDNVDGSTHSYTAVAYNEYGDPLDNAVTLALKAAVSGVSISKGVVTLTSAVADGTTFIVKGTVAANATVAEFPVTVLVRAVDHIVVSGDAVLVNDSTNGLTSDAYTAVAYDEHDVEVVATITFALKEPVAGVSINANTGVVTLTSTVADETAFIIVASDANSIVTAEFPVTVSVPAE